MSDPEEKAEIAASRSTTGAARASLTHLEQRYGRLTKKRQLAPGDRVLLEPMDGVEVWRVASITDEKTWLELEDLMTQLRLIQGEGKPERPCSRCGEKWDGTDDKQHGAHRCQAQCSHIAVFNCQMEQIGSYCDCPPSGPAYPRQPHEARYEMDTAGNMRKVEGPPPAASPPATAPAPSPQPEVVVTFPEPVDHREEVGGFGRGDPCTFQHRFNKDGVCAACGTKVPEGCTCAPSGTAVTGYVHAPSCQLQPAAQPAAPKKKMLIVDVAEGESEGAAKDRAARSLEEIITTTADQAAKLIAPADGSPPQDAGAVLAAARDVVDQAVAQALDQVGIPREAMAGPAPDAGEERLAWVTVDGHGMGCDRCGLWEPIPKEPGAAAAAIAKFEGEHLFCPEKQG